MGLYFIIFSIVFFVLSNVFVYRTIKHNTLKRFIRPFLERKGMVDVTLKSPGFLSTGHFKERGFKISPVSENGKIVNFTYFLAIAKNKAGNDLQFSVKVRTIFLKIVNVHIKSEGIDERIL